MLAKVGLITIGQSPREDIVPHITRILGPEIQVQEIGALDDASPGAGEYRYSGQQGPVYVTRLRDKSQVEVAESTLLPLIRQCVSRLREDGISTFGLLCTGEYPDLANIPGLVRPYPVLHRLVDALLPVGRLGVIVPSVRQVEDKKRDWASPGREVHVAAASPYSSEEELQNACGCLKASGSELVVLDCLGFSYETKMKARTALGVPVVMAGSVFAWTMKELL
ncbi:MAG: AroM family protein [Bacillota bacterium]